MVDIHGIGAFGYIPYLSEDLAKEIKQANIQTTRAGKIAYLLTIGEIGKKPRIEEGVHKARGALKWIQEAFKENTGSGRDEMEDFFHEK